MGTVSAVRNSLHTGRRALGVEVGDDYLVLCLKCLLEPLVVSEYQPPTRTRCLVCLNSHLLVDIRKMAESPRRGRESSDELLGWKSKGDVEHILRSTLATASVETGYKPPDRSPPLATYLSFPALSVPLAPSNILRAP